MRQRGYTIAFLAVLLVSCLAALLGGRWLWQTFQADVNPASAWVPPDQRTSTPATPLPDDLSLRPSGQPTATVAARPAPNLAAVTLTPFALPTATASLTPVEFPTSPIITLTPSPTATTTLPGQFVAVGLVRNSSGDCPGTYVLGRVSDQAGKGLPGIRLHLIDEYGNGEYKTTKSGASEAGNYDFPLTATARRLYLSVVDAAGQPLSAQVEIDHGLGANPSANCHRVEWRKQ